MSTAIRLLHGDFGRLALLQMDAALVTHAHHHCHILIKASGPDTAFCVNGQNAPLTDENAVLINAWEPHSYIHELADPEERPVILALYLEPPWLSRFSKDINPGLYPKFFARCCSALLEHQKRLIESIVMELWWSDTIAHDKIEVILAELSLSFLEGADSAARVFSQKHRQDRNFMDARVRRAIGLLKDNPDLASDMATLAQAVDLSRSHFFELFRRCTGLSPLVYANALKMERALHALAVTTKPMEDVSSDLGFSAQSHFSRFFRQHQGVVPSHYRRQVEAKEFRTI